MNYTPLLATISLKHVSQDLGVGRGVKSFTIVAFAPTVNIGLLIC